jgi:hypothetical protein
MAPSASQWHRAWLRWTWGRTSRADDRTRSRFGSSRHHGRGATGTGRGLRPSSTTWLWRLLRLGGRWTTRAISVVRTSRCLSTRSSARTAGCTAGNWGRAAWRSCVSIGTGPARQHLLCRQGGCRRPGATGERLRRRASASERLRCPRGTEDARPAAPGRRARDPGGRPGMHACPASAGRAAVDPSRRGCSGIGETCGGTWNPCRIRRRGRSSRCTSSGTRGTRACVPR